MLNAAQITSMEIDDTSLKESVSMETDDPSLAETDPMAVDEYPPALIFTETAAKKVKSLLLEMAEEEEDPTLARQMLRIAIQGGGCSGFKYDFSFTNETNDLDTAVETEGVKLVVDSISMQYLEGATIDYKEDASGEEFVITNPNATGKCGCGSSFSAG